MPTQSPGARQPAAWKPAPEGAARAGTTTAGTASDSNSCTATRHGTSGAYRHAGCRCPDAREDNRIYYKRLREHRSAPRVHDSTGTVRRLHALQALGWPIPAIAERLGMSGHALDRVSRRRRVYTATLTKVCGVYDRLSMESGPSERVRRIARTKGWPPPLAWDNIDDPAETPSTGTAADSVVDLVLVDRCASGQTPAGQLNRAEQEQAVRILHGHRLNDCEIARRMTWHAKSVHRIRAERLRLPAVPIDHGRREAG